MKSLVVSFVFLGLTFCEAQVKLDSLYHHPNQDQESISGFHDFEYGSIGMFIGAGSSLSGWHSYAQFFPGTKDFQRTGGPGIFVDANVQYSGARFLSVRFDPFLEFWWVDMGPGGIVGVQDTFQYNPQYISISSGFQKGADPWVFASSDIYQQPMTHYALSASPTALFRDTIVLGSHMIASNGWLKEVYLEGFSPVFVLEAFSGANPYYEIVTIDSDLAPIDTFQVPLTNLPMPGTGYGSLISKSFVQSGDRYFLSVRHTTHHSFLELNDQFQFSGLSVSIPIAGNCYKEVKKSLQPSFAKPHDLFDIQALEDGSALVYSNWRLFDQLNVTDSSSFSLHYIDANGNVEWSNCFPPHQGYGNLTQLNKVKEFNDSTLILFSTDYVNRGQGFMDSPRVTRILYIGKDGEPRYDMLSNEGPAQEKDFKVYPNPAQSYVEVSVNFQLTGTYTIINSMGQLVKTGQLNSNQNRIDLQDLSAGVYHISIPVSDGILTQSFVKR